MIGLIVARSKNNVIGKNGRIPWQIEGEKQEFKELTTGNIVVMGRRTFEEIGRPLPGRFTIVVSKSKKFEGENLKSVESVTEALEFAGKMKMRDIFFAGGYSIYKEALPFVDVMYITEINLVIEDGDTFFPEFNADDFEITFGKTAGDEIKYRRTFYKRKNLKIKKNCE